jgi:hypothetical protein
MFPDILSMDVLLKKSLGTSFGLCVHSKIDMKNFKILPNLALKTVTT